MKASKVNQTEKSSSFLEKVHRRKHGRYIGLQATASVPSAKNCREIRRRGGAEKGSKTLAHTAVNYNRALGTPPSSHLSCAV